MEYWELKEQVKEKLAVPQEFDGSRNLLELGLSSIKIMRLVNQWRKQGIRVSFGALMEEPMLDRWWMLMEKGGNHSAQMNEIKKEESGKVAEIHKPFPLTDVQYAYKIGRADGEELGGIGCHAYLEFDGLEISAERLENAWNIVQNHHPMLKSRFSENGQQEIMEAPYEEHITVKDLRGCPDPESALEKIRDGLSHRKLKVEDGQVAGITLSLLPDGKARIHFDLDLLVADVLSLQIILRDLASAYAGKALPKASGNWSFAAYLEEQEKEDREGWEKARDYWRKREEDFPVGPDLPLAKHPSEVTRTKFTRRTVFIERKEWDHLQEKAAKYQATPAMLLLSAYAMVLERFSKSKRFLINIPFFNRKTEYEGLEDAVADFTTLLLLEVDMRKKQTFREVLGLIQSQMHRDMKYTMYSGVQVQRDISSRVGENRSIAPVVFACNLGDPFVDREFEQKLGKMSYMISQTPGVWLDFQIYENERGLILAWDTVDELFPEGMIGDMFQSLKDTLHQLEQESWDQYPDVLPEHQAAFIARQKKIEPVEHPERLFDGFLKNAKKTPDKIAIIDTGRNVKKTYRELEQIARSVAAFLNSAKIQGQPIAISVTRGYLQAAAALGILMSGNEYVPVSLKQPKERRALIHQKTGIHSVITDRESYPAVIWPDHTQVWMIEEMCATAPLKKLPEIPAESSAYIIMTSGTTGEPKGAEIRHSGSWNTINDINSRWNVTAEDVLLGVSAMDFDLSVYDLFGTLGSGGTLVMIPEDRSRDAEFWLEQILKYQVTVWNSVPVLLDMLLIQAESRKVRLPLKLALLSGDWIDIKLPERLAQVTQGCRFIAMGGATEAGIWSNYEEVTLPLPRDWKSIPYGRPLSHQAYRVVDEKGMDAPYWVEGELWIGGAGIGTYCGDPELTAKKFVSDDSGRWYRTGDKGRFWPDGTIEFLGRDDYQIKIRGHRIELGEIETALKRMENIRNAVVEPFCNTAKEQYLAAFLECRDMWQEPLFYKDAEVLEQINRKWEALAKSDEIPENKEEFRKILAYGEKRTCETMLETLRKMGAFAENRGYRSEEIILSGNIAKEQRYTVLRWLSVLTAHGYLENTDEGFSLSEPVFSDTEDERLMAKAEGIERYLGRLKPHLPALLQGQKRPADIYYVENENLTPNDLLAQLPEMESAVRLLVSKIRAVLDQSEGKRVRILEYGTRNEKITEKILSGLRGADVTYIYADTSLFFTEKIKALTEKYPFVKSEILDIETDIGKSGRDYDCVIAVNAFHRMKRKEDALKNAGHLLKDTGVLLALELTIRTCMQDVTATILEQHEDIKEQEQILDISRWETLLRENGFDKVMRFPAEGRICGQNLLTAMSTAHAYKIDIDYIHSKIGDRLPEYMIPKIYHAMESLPLSKNGKIDRKKLHVFETHQELENKRTEPVTKTEQELCEIWKSIFQKEKIGTQDNYYLLGGDSLIATRMVTKIRERFQITFTIADLMGNKTVREQAIRIEQMMANEEKRTEDRLPRILPDKQHENEPFPLTDVQQAYWIGRKGMYGLGGVSTHCYFELDAMDINLVKLQKAWNELIVRHGMMRAVIHADGTQQILRTVPEYQIAVEHLEGCKTNDQKKRLENIREEMSHQVIAADVWPLYEVRITMLQEKKSRIHISFDNLIFDGWSMFHILSEWADRSRGKRLESEELELSFRDYVLTLEKCRKSERYERDQAYWKKRIDNFAMAPELPLAKREEEITKQRFHRRESYLTPEQWERLRQSAKNYGITPAVLLMTAYAETLRRWSKNPDFTLNLTQFNRKALHPQVNRLVGDFTTLTLLEVKNGAKKTFLARARKLQEQLMDDLEHTSYSAVDLERELRKKTGNTRGSIMPVVFTSGLGIDQWRDGKWIGKLVYNVSQTPQVWLDHQVVERDGGLGLFWDSVDELFYPGMLDEMFEAYTGLLRRLAADPELFDLPESSLVKVKISKVRNAANETTVEFPAETLDELFLQMEKRYPDKEAVVASDRRMTYREVKQEALYIAQYLRDQGVKQGGLAAVMMEKGWEQVVAVYGALFAGAAYLPVDIHNPKDRIQKILADGRVSVVLVQEEVLRQNGWLQAYDCLVVNGKKAEDHTLPVKNTPDALAYVIYTSGSTGVPKGVMIPHKGAVNTIQAVNRRYRICETDTAMAISNLHFDLSVYDIFGVLGAGGRIVIPDHRKAKDPAHWSRLMNRENITVWNSVPAFMEMFAEYEEYQKKLESSALRVIMMSGDWIPVTLPERLYKIFGAVDMAAMGGATEASIWSNVFDIPDTIPDTWKSIPYGKPLPNQKYYILDVNGKDCPDWVPGMLYIGGSGVADGYLNDREKTAEKFRNHEVTGERLYCTGDIGCYWADGNIEFLGRADDQVKINGYRVEPGEIESSLLKIKGVTEAAVLLARSGSKEWMKAVLVEEKEYRERGSEFYREQLKEKLPAYMIPAEYVTVDQIPLNANGKKDIARMETFKQSKRNVDVEEQQTEKSPLEDRLLEIWKGVLKDEMIGIHDNFFELGGNSLQAIQIMNEMTKKTGHVIDIDALFQYPTISKMGQYIAGKAK